MFRLRRAYIFFLFVILLMGIDFCATLSTGVPFIYSLLAFYVVALSFPISILRIASLLLLLSLESFFFYGQWGVQLIYLLPIALYSRTTWDIFIKPWQHALFLLIACLVAQYTLDIILGLHVHVLMFMLSCCVNGVLVYLFARVY